MPDQLPIINYSFNWNGKLFCHAFSTIRLRNDHKYRVGQRYEVHLNNRLICQGVIQSISNITLDKITPAMAYIDTGYSLEKCKQTILTMYKNKNIAWATQQFSFIIIEGIDKPMLPFPEELYQAKEVPQ